MDMLVITIVALSTLVQIAAAARAVMLIRISGGLAAWLFLAGAALLMSVRRPVTLYHIFTGAGPGDLLAETLALLISLLMLCGICLIKPLFVTLRESREKLEKVHNELAESELRFRTLAESTSDWIYWLALDGSIRYTSPSCEEICGYGAADFYREPQLIAKIIHPEDLPIYQAHLKRFLEGGAPLRIDLRIITRDGRERWIAHTCRRINDADGSSLGRQVSVRDITARKEMEAELTASEQQYRQLSESLEERVAQTAAELAEKSQLLIIQGRQAVMGEMLRNIAHQWRQPLNTLALLAQELILSFEVKGYDPQTLETNVARMMETIRQMSKTIDNFRNFFRGSTERERYSVREVLESSLSLLEPSLAAQQVRTEVEVSADRVVDGCPSDLSQVFLNVIGNARDAFASGEVGGRLVKVRLFSEGDRTVVTVADNAGGIPEEILDKIFDPYFTTKGPDKGTGIGLFMSKTIVQKHLNGSISASNTGSGAEFRIEF